MVTRDYSEPASMVQQQRVRPSRLTEEMGRRCEHEGISMKSMMRTAVLGLAILAGACLPVTTKTPVGSTVGFKPDQGLFGVWRGYATNSNAHVYLTIFKGASDGETVAVLVSAPAKAGDDGFVSVYDLKTATLGGHRFLSARGLDFSGCTKSNRCEAEVLPKDATVPLLYRIVGRTLALYLLDNEATAAAIRSGAVRGSVEPDLRDKDGKIIVHGDVKLTDDGATLDRFIQSASGLALFKSPFLELRKVD